MKLLVLNTQLQQIGTQASLIYLYLSSPLGDFEANLRYHVISTANLQYDSLGK